jgi:hypothetical protein
VNSALYATAGHNAVQAAGLGQHTGHIILLFFPVLGVAGLAVREWVGARRNRQGPRQ